MSNQRFRNLHRGSGILLLPNAWDGVSARLMESLGAKAIATTSAAVAWAHGYPDGNALPVDQLIAATRDIARVIRVPLTIDIEAGYSKDPAEVTRLADRLVAVGAVGINIEDGAGSPDLLCRKIAAIRDHVARSGDELFINARADVYLRGVGSGEAATAETMRRGLLYREAGCDGLFVPGLSSVDAIAAISASIEPMPLNVMVVPNLPAIGTLQKSGVRRLSAGSSIAQAALGCTSRVVSGFLAGAMSEMFDGTLGYGEVNQLFAENVHA
jgi:2-methylisocitrate lyase-like PEP mutase family enzyme